MLFKLIHFLSWFLLWFFVALLLLFTVVYFGLQTSIVETKILPYLQPLIKEKSGVDLRMKHFSFDLFGHLTIENLSVKKIDQKNNQTMDVRLQKLNLDYDIWELFNKRIVINELSFNGLELYGILSLDETSQTKPKSQQSSSTISQQQLTNIINHPPIAFDLTSLEIKPIDIDVELSTQEQKVHYQGRVDFNSSAHWNNSGLSGIMALDMNESTFELVKDDTDKIKLFTHPMMDSKINWQVKKSKERLLVELKPTHFLLASGKTDLSHYQKEKKIELALQEWKVQLNLQGVSELFHPLNSVLQWKLEQNILASKASLKSNDTVVTLNPWKFHSSLQGSIDRVQNLNNTLKVDFNSTKFTLKKPNQSLKVIPKYNLNIDTKLTLESDGNRTKIHWKPSKIEAIQHLEMKEFLLHQANNTLAIHQENWRAHGEFKNNQILLHSNLSLKECDTPSILKKFSIDNQFSLDFDPKFQNSHLQTMFSLDDLPPLLNLSLNIDNAPQHLRVTPLIDVNMPQSLNHYFKEAKPLTQIGDINVDVNGTIAITHSQKSALDVNWSQYMKMPFQSDIQLTLKQLHQPKQGLLQIKEPIKSKILFSKSASAEYNNTISLNSDALLYPPLKKPLPINFFMKNSTNRYFNNISSNAKIALDNHPFIKYNLHLMDKPKKFMLKSLWDIHADPKLQSYLSQLEVLEQLGALHLESQFDLNLTHPYKRIRLLNPSKLQELKTSIEFDGVLQQEHHNKYTKIFIDKPLQFQQSIQWQKESASLNAHYNIQKMNLMNKLNLEELFIGASLHLNDGIKPNALRANIESNGSKITLFSNKKSPIEVSPLLLPLSLSIDGKLNQDTNNLELRRLECSLGDRWLEQHLKGFLSLDGNSSEINGYTIFQPRDHLLSAPLPLLSGSGKMSIPWQIKVSTSKWLSLKSEMIFDNLSLNTKTLSLSSINGKFHINEDMILHKDGNISFEYLLKTNPFQRVDFNKIEPYLNNQEKLSIKTIKLDHTTIGPMQAMIPIQQNLIELQQFNLKLFGGHVVGQVYLNTTPKHWSFGLLVRATHIDLRKALQDKKHFTSSPISARIAMEFDFSKRLLEGEINISDIDQSQLLQLLELIDPEHQDAQISQLRDALRYAYPESVTIKMNSGLLNLSVSLSLISNPITIRGVPLSPLIERFSSKILNKVNNLPLQ